MATEAAAKGPRWAQEGVVLREVRDRLSGGRPDRPDLQTQQTTLNAWHDLFTEKKLAAANCAGASCQRGNPAKSGQAA